MTSMNIGTIRNRANSVRQVSLAGKFNFPSDVLPPTKNKCESPQQRIEIFAIGRALGESARPMRISTYALTSCESSKARKDFESHHIVSANSDPNKP